MENIRWILLGVGILIILGVYLSSRIESWRDLLPQRRPERQRRRAQAADPLLDDLDGAGPDAMDMERDLVMDEVEEMPPAAPVSNSGTPCQERVFSLFVMAPPSVPFRGPVLLGALKAAGLEYGDMQIFHYIEVIDGREKVLFSAANVREPGTFDLLAMDRFATEGIALFMQVPGSVDAVHAFDAMVRAARALADQLDGSVCDQTRSVITGQTMAHLREEVISCQLQQRVASTGS